MSGGIKMELKFNCLKSLFFLIVCICLFITSSCVYAGDMDNFTLINVDDIDMGCEDDIISPDINQVGDIGFTFENSTDKFTVADIDTDCEDNIISSDFNQIDDLRITFENSTDGFIDYHTFYVVNSQFSYFAEDNAYSAEYGGFVLFENCLIKISQDDRANAGELIGYCEITENNVKILNSTFTNLHSIKTGSSDVEYLCNDVMSPICFGNNGSASRCMLSCNAMDGGVMDCSGNNGVGDISISQNISTSGILCESYSNGLNYTVCNNSAVNASNGLSRGSGHYNRSGKNVNITSSFDCDSMLSNNFAKDNKNYSRNNIDISKDISFILYPSINYNYVNANSSNVFVLTVNGNLNEFEFAFAKDDLGDIHTFLFNEDSLDILSLVKNSHDCRKQCEIFGINPVYSLKYDSIIANTSCFYTNFSNTIFSNFYLTDCSDFLKTLFLNTDFKNHHALFNGTYDFSKILPGMGKSGVFSVLSAEEIFALDISSSTHDFELNRCNDQLVSSSLNNNGMNYCIEKILSLVVIDGEIAINSNMLYYCVVENGIKHVCIGDEIMWGYNYVLNALEIKREILTIMKGEVM